MRVLRNSYFTKLLPHHLSGSLLIAGFSGFLSSISISWVANLYTMWAWKKNPYWRYFYSVCFCRFLEYYCSQQPFPDQSPALWNVSYHRKISKTRTRTERFQKFVFFIEFVGRGDHERDFIQFREIPLHTHYFPTTHTI